MDEQGGPPVMRANLIGALLAPVCYLVVVLAFLAL